MRGPMRSGREWVESLHLPAQRELLRGLLRHAEADPAVRFLELCCSVARGDGDELSDLDLGLGIADEAWPQALDGLAATLAEIGEVVDMIDHELPAWAGTPHRRYFVQYASVAQVDLVAMPASKREGMPAGSIALYDPEGRLANRVVPTQASTDAAGVREWAFHAWVALANLDKYLRRGSLWEALEQLHEARGMAWRLWAAARGVPYAAFGMTPVLDESPVVVPPGLDATVARLDAVDLRRAALILVSILEEVGRAAALRLEARYPDAMAAFVSDRLRAGAAAE